tara:strand:+ start:2216 stop:3133 length:918 start_codon:yes stop_codon:yes gene_type:complete
MSKGIVQINFTIGFGNNLFQYVYGRLFAEKNNLELVHRAIPELGIPEQLRPIDRSLPTFYISDSNYKQCLYSSINLKNNFIINGYFEDYKFITPQLKNIQTWFTPCKITNKEDVILHLRLQNRLVQESHHKNHITADSIKNVLSKMQYKRLNIVTDAEKWRLHTASDIHKIQEQIKTGPNQSAPWVSTEQSLEYINHLVEELSCLEPIVHCNGAKMIRGSGGLRDNFIEDFNLIRSFDKVIIHNSTFSWWAAALSGASQVAIFDPWKIAKKPEDRRNLGKTSFPGWFSWGGPEDLYFKKYRIKGD